VHRSNRRAAAATPAAALGRGGRDRMAPAEGGLRAVYQQVLRSFATIGVPPAASDLTETAARHNTTAEAVLAALHTGDFLRLGADGQIRAAGAAAWASGHPQATGDILGHAAALRLGTAIFGQLLAGDY
jgi:hypothetical protein